MELSTLTDIGQLVGLALTAAGVFIAVWVYRRQTNTLVFLEYTRRYEEIMKSYPDSARGARLDLSGEPPPESDDLSAVVLQYLNLSSEEFYLCTKGYLMRDIWNMWEKELRRTLKSPLLKREWRKLRREFSSYSEFSEYVENAQRGGEL